MDSITGEEDSGLPGGRALTNLVDAALGDPGSLPEAQAAVRDTLGPGALVDAAAVMSTFQKMTRFADATGIPLDAPTEMASRNLRNRLGLDEFESAHNTPPPGRLQGMAAGVIERVAPVALRVIARLQRRLMPRR